MDFSNCVIVQFNLKPSKKINPLRANPLVLMKSDKYVENAHFWGVARGSKCGIYVDTAATHWGIFDLTDPKNPKILLTDKFEDTPRVRKVYKIDGMYAVMRKCNRYYKFQIANFSSIKELKNSAINQNEEK